jgi:hypothetical protein
MQTVSNDAQYLLAQSCPQGTREEGCDPCNRSFSTRYWVVFGQNPCDIPWPLKLVKKKLIRRLQDCKGASFKFLIFWNLPGISKGLPSIPVKECLGGSYTVVRCTTLPVQKSREAVDRPYHRHFQELEVITTKDGARAFPESTECR